MFVRSLLFLALPATALAQEPVPVDVELTPAAPAARLPVLFDSDQEVSASQPSDDVFLLGQRVSVDAHVADNAFLMGQVTDVNQPVSGDLFAMGETVTVEAPVAGDVYALGKVLIVTDRGSVGGNVFGGGETIEIRGPVGGDLSLGAGTVILAAPVGGDAKLQVGQLVLESGGAVAGDLAYEAPAPVDGLDQVVGGSVNFTQHVEEPDEPEEPEAPPGLIHQLMHWSLWTTWSFGSKLLVGFAFLALGGAGAGRVARSLLEAPARAVGLGFVVTALLPIASLMAIALVLPLPLGLLGFVALGVALYAAQLLAAQAVGDLILRRVRPDALGNPYISMAVGLLPLVLLASVPWIGTLAWFAATIAGVGAICVALSRPPVVQA